MMWEDNHEYWEGKLLEGGGYDMFESNILTFTWRDWGESWKPHSWQPVTQLRLNHCFPNEWKSPAVLLLAVAWEVIILVLIVSVMYTSVQRLTNSTTGSKKWRSMKTLHVVIGCTCTYLTVKLVYSYKFVLLLLLSVMPSRFRTEFLVFCFSCAQ